MSNGAQWGVVIVACGLAAWAAWRAGSAEESVRDELVRLRSASAERDASIEALREDVMTLRGKLATQGAVLDGVQEVAIRASTLTRELIERDAEPGGARELAARVAETTEQVAEQLHDLQVKFAATRLIEERVRKLEEKQRVLNDAVIDLAKRTGH